MITKIKQEIKKWKNFAIFSLALALFFVLEYFHNWANDFFINLHFCDHLFCMIFSAIFFAFAYFAWQKKRSYLNMAIIVLIVGIILMNLTYCEGGQMYLGDFSFGSFSIFSINETICKPGVVCCEHNCTVPIPPCLETDFGRDYLSYGVVRSGVNIDDICLEDGNLRERYCNSELTYTSEDIDCEVTYGTDWTCIEGECRYSATPTPPTPEDKENTLALCSDGADNDGDGFADCLDSDCAEFCPDCDHADYPACLAYCSETSTCKQIFLYDGTPDGGICSCVPDGEIACSDEGIPGDDRTCTGYCPYDMYCVNDKFGCFCQDFPCFDFDHGFFIEEPGTCMNLNLTMFDDYCLDDEILIEYTCSSEGCIPNEINCSVIYGGAGYECVSPWGIGYCAI